MENFRNLLRNAIDLVPSVQSLLSDRARNLFLNYPALKTYDYFLSTLSNLVQSVYDGRLGGEFVDILNNLIVGQLAQAYEQAWTDDGNELPPPAYLQSAVQEFISEQQGFVQDFYRSIVDARVDQTGVDALLARVPLWANRWNEAYNEAVNFIASQTGGKQIWLLGATEKHCPFCRALNGIVAYASEWLELGVHPQGAPNPMLTGDKDGEKGCEGWLCDCKLDNTDQRRSPKAFESIMNAVNR